MADKPISIKDNVDRKLEALKSNRKRIDLSKYAGKVKFDIDPLEYQKQVRDEWR